MELPRLIEALSSPAAYPYPTEKIEVHQTHISVVLLAGEFAYKIKKPVKLGFLDFSTLEKRRHFCEEEVRLNRRLAPAVYLGVVPVTEASSGGLRFEGDGPMVEWAVKMQRLPEAATVRERLNRGEIKTEHVEHLACCIAAFHKNAEANEHMASFGRFEAVSRIVLDIFDEARAHVDHTVSRAVFDRLLLLTREHLSRLQSLIEERASRGMTRECHGDLHLDHVYFFPERKAPGDLIIVDCIEFNERFRFIDPVADMAFAAMELTFSGRRELARVFVDSYFQAAGDKDGMALLPLYTSYRTTVRGLVGGLKLAEQEIPAAEREVTLKRARAHWLLALTELEEPGRKPCLLLIGGLPGAGKSVLGRRLAAAAGFCVIRSDIVRKELAGLPLQSAASAQDRKNLYTAEWTEKTYRECARRVEQLLFEGKRVIVDATFRDDSRRRDFLELATHCGVPGAVFLCQAEAETIRRRLAGRQDDASDADWFVYMDMAASWQEPGPLTQGAARLIRSDGSEEETLAQALRELGKLGLYPQFPAPNETWAVDFGGITASQESD